MPLLEDETETKEQRAGGAAVATETGIAYTREGDGVREERLGATSPDAAQFDDSTNAARMKALEDIRVLSQKVDEIKAYAASKGQQAPDIDVQALSQDPTGMSGQDLAMLQQQIDRVEQAVRHEEGKQLQQQAGDTVGALAGLSMIGGGAAGLLASLGIAKSGAEMGVSGGENLSNGALFTAEIRNGIEGIGIQQQRGRGGMEMA